jgi:hypothetical protein
VSHVLDKDSVRVLVPVGMLGGGFPASTIDRGIALGADVIAVDGGSTDSGPHYLGTATAKTARGAVARDLANLVPAAKRAGIPLIVGSCGTSGTDRGVEWIRAVVDQVAREAELSISVGCIFSELDPTVLEHKRTAGAVRPLAPADPLDAATLAACVHIVGLMGHEPIAAALDHHVDVVLAGRATDTALVAALPLSRGLPAGPVWHGSKITECGGLCTTNPRGGGVLVAFDETGFSIEPLDEASRCTPATVAAHMMYENGDPFRMREPGGTLDTTAATYEALDDRRVRVEGSRFEAADQQTIKIEGAALVGFETMIISGIRDPKVLARISEWCDQVLDYVRIQVPPTLGLDPGEFQVQILRYGHDAVLGVAEPFRSDPPREVGIVLRVRAADQETATQIAKLANPVLLHAPLPGDTELPSFAFLGSPAEIERGSVHEFVLQHAVDVDTPDELFRTSYGRVGLA